MYDARSVMEISGARNTAKYMIVLPLNCESVLQYFAVVGVLVNVPDK